MWLDWGFLSWHKTTTIFWAPKPLENNLFYHHHNLIYWSDNICNVYKCCLSRQKSPVCMLYGPHSTEAMWKILVLSIHTKRTFLVHVLLSNFYRNEWGLTSDTVSNSPVYINGFWGFSGNWFCHKDNESKTMETKKRFTIHIRKQAGWLDRHEQLLRNVKGKIRHLSCACPISVHGNCCQLKQ